MAQVEHKLQRANPHSLAHVRDGGETTHHSASWLAPQSSKSIPSTTNGVVPAGARQEGTRMIRMNRLSLSLSLSLSTRVEKVNTPIIAHNQGGKQLHQRHRVCRKKSLTDEAVLPAVRPEAALAAPPATKASPEPQSVAATTAAATTAEPRRKGFAMAALSDRFLFYRG